MPLCRRRVYPVATLAVASRHLAAALPPPLSPTENLFERKRRRKGKETPLFPVLHNVWVQAALFGCFLSNTISVGERGGAVRERMRQNEMEGRDVTVARLRTAQDGGAQDPSLHAR